VTLEKAELKLRIAELIDALVSARMSMADAQEEIEQLRKRVAALEDQQSERATSCSAMTPTGRGSTTLQIMDRSAPSASRSTRKRFICEIWGTDSSAALRVTIASTVPTSHLRRAVESTSVSTTDVMQRKLPSGDRCKGRGVLYA